MNKVAIIGGGFCGSLLSAHLLRRAQRPIEIFLIERKAVARGAAYGTKDPGHLLNVPAGNMSAWPDDPHHFLRWLRERPQICGLNSPDNLGAGSFAPRLAYGVYLESVLSEAVSAAKPHAQFQIIHDEAIALDGEKALDISLASGRRITAQKAVLALGNLPPRTPESLAALARSPRYLQDPWNGVGLDQIGSRESVLLIGLGLTMADVVVSLLGRGHTGPIVAFSRHGLLPQSHGASSVVDTFPETGSTRKILRWLRRLSEASGWRSGMDKLRPRVQELWLSLDVKERRRFLRHLRPYWDSHRHRLPEQIHGLLTSLTKSGRLQIIAGRLESVNGDPETIRASLRLRHKGTVKEIKADWLVNCTGPECDPEESGEPLIKSLLQSGLARPDPLRLGIETDRSGSIIAKDGMPSSRLYALGAWRKGTLWETVAVPDLRVQVQELASHLINQGENE